MKKIGETKNRCQRQNHENCKPLGLKKHFNYMEQEPSEHFHLVILSNEFLNDTSVLHMRQAVKILFPLKYLFHKIG